MRTYTGHRAMGTCSVKVTDDGRDRDGEPGTASPEATRTYWLPRIGTRLLKAMPSFEWGYYGPGPRHLALALLADATGDEQLALHYHDRFAAVVADLPRDGGFTLTDQQISDWLTRTAGTEIFQESTT